jgi:hypothetical protein
MEAPNPKHQISNKSNHPNSKQMLGLLKLEFGAYLKFGICDLGF